MRLLDQVAQASEPFIVEDDELGPITLPGVALHADAVSAAPLRLILMPDLVAACRDLITLQPKLLQDCCDLVRVPSTRLWVEWSRNDLSPDGARIRSGQRAGLLVEADEQGRSGTMRSFWDDPQHGVECAPATAVFDYDRPAGAAPAPAAGHSELNAVAARADVILDPEWRRYYERTSCGDATVLHSVLGAVRQGITEDFLVLTALSLLLSMPRDVEHRTSDLARLNQARARRGKPALLDHTEVSVSILPQDRIATHPDSAGRSAARLHHVRGHMVRRRQSVFWRRPHLRGSAELGASPTRTVRLSLGPGASDQAGSAAP